MKTIIVPTYTVRLYMAGEIEAAKAFLRRECYPPNKGLCVTVDPTSFIYTGGEESGFVVGFVNYPRFPCEPGELWARARAVAERMIPELCQLSCLLVAPDQSEWLSMRPEDNK